MGNKGSKRKKETNEVNEHNNEHGVGNRPPINSTEESHPITSTNKPGSRLETSGSPRSLGKLVPPNTTQIRRTSPGLSPAQESSEPKSTPVQTVAPLRRFNEEREDEPETIDAINTRLEAPLLNPYTNYICASFLPTISVENYFTITESSPFFGKLNRTAYEYVLDIVKKPISCTNIDHLALEKLLEGHLLAFFTTATVQLLYDSHSEEEIAAEGAYPDIEALQNFALEMEKLYFDVPFHCKTRAALRVHATISKLGRFPKKTFSLLDELAIVIAACMKDIRHPGLNNTFQINYMSTLARLYNFDLPLENYACYMAFQTMKENQTCDFTKKMTTKAAKHLRERVLYLCIESSRNDLFVYTVEMRNLIEGLSRAQILEVPTTNPNVFFPFLLHMADQAHFWGITQGGHNYWHTQEMRELLHQADIEERLSLPQTVPSRKAMRMSFDEYCFYVNQRFAYIDDGMYLLQNLLSMVNAHNIMQQNILWWNSQVNENSPIFLVTFENPVYNPERIQQMLDSEVNTRRFPKFDVNVRESIQQEFSRKLISDQGKNHLLGEILDYICNNFDNHGDIKLPENLRPIPFIVKNMSNSLELAKHLSYEEKKSAILYHMMKYRDLDFDVFSLTVLLGDAPLVFIGRTIIESRNLTSMFKIPNNKLITFLHRIQSSYQHNPYHNAIHGACIVQATEYVLRKSLDAFQISKLYYLALYIAAAAHDIDHPGMNNAYQRNSNSYLSILYNNRSVIENHSASRCIELLLDPECSIFENISEETRATLFRVIVTCILATDMERHALLLSRFKEFTPDYNDDNDVLFAASMVLKLSDLVNSFRPQRIYIQWAARICTEFLQQGDYERFHGYEIGPFNDRDRLSLERSQHFFLDKVVRPFLEVFHDHYPHTHNLVSNLADNIQYWEKMIEEQHQSPIGSLARPTTTHQSTSNNRDGY